MLNEGFLLPFFSPIFALALTKNIKNEVQQATTAISFSSLVAHTHCPCWDAALLLQQHQNTVSEAPACFKSPCTSTIPKFRTAGIFSWHCTLRHTASKWTVILREEENKIPVPKQGSTVILLLHPNQDVTYQVLKAPCLCTGRGVFISDTSWGAALCWAGFGSFHQHVPNQFDFPTVSGLVSSYKYSVWQLLPETFGLLNAFLWGWGKDLEEAGGASLASILWAASFPPCSPVRGDPWVRREEKSLSASETGKEQGLRSHRPSTCVCVKVSEVRELFKTQLLSEGEHHVWI